MNKLKIFTHLTIVIFIAETFACQGRLEGNLFRHHEESQEKLSKIESRMIPLPIPTTGTGSAGAFPSGIPVPELTCTGDDIHLYIHIKLDYFGNETHWDVKDVFENTIVHESTEIYKALGVYTHEICLPCSRYIFTIYDDHGDGLYYPYGYIVKVNSELAKSSGLVLPDDEQSLTNNSTDPFATFVGASDSVQFRGQCTAAIDYFQIQSDQVENGVSYCLQARSKDQGAVIVAKPCTRTISEKLQFWIVDSYGQIQNMADRTMCLAGGAIKNRLTIEPCMTVGSLTKEKTLFIYNYFTRNIHFVKNAMRIIHMPNNVEKSKVIRLRNMEVLPDSTSKAKRQWTIKFI